MMVWIVNWKIQDSEYRVVKYLGRGAYGEVYSAYAVGEQRKPVALKITKTKRVPSRLGDMDREVFEKLTRIKHRNLVTFHRYFQSNALTCISMQMCHGPDLQMYMSKYRYRPLEAKRVIWSILNGVAYMHSHNIIHNDLKLENVMYLRANPEYLGPEVHSEVVIIDFGLAQVLTDGKAQNLLMGTPEYMPPEKLKRRDKFTTTKSDMWALGVLSFIIYCGFFPYPFPTNTSHSQIYETIMRQNVDWPRRHELMIANDDEHRLAKAFLKTLLQKEPSARTESAQSLLHPWFDEILNVVPLDADDSKRPYGNEEFRPTWPVIRFPNKSPKEPGRRKIRRRHSFPAYRKFHRSPRTNFPAV